MSSVDTERDYMSLNATVNLYQEVIDPETGEKVNRIQFEKDAEAAKQYFLQHINPNTVFFHTLREKYDFLIDNNYYETEWINKYDFDFIKSAHERAYAYKHRFSSLAGALKFYGSYTLKMYTEGSERYLERFEDRVVTVALVLADGSEELANRLIDEVMSGRFQWATPTFINLGKVARGEPTSCYLLRASDTMESIGRVLVSALQLSKRGGGVAILLTDLRENGAPIKGIPGQANSVIPVMKLLDLSFSFANQLGTRDGAGAVYLHAHHPDIMEFLDTRRENSDERVRIKSLSIGVVIPDITFELAKRNADMYLFSPHDIKKFYGKDMSDISITDMYDELVENDKITKKKISARHFLATLAELQMQSGYPYIMFEDAANRSNPIEGRINMSNLCSEILQVNTPSKFNSDLSYIEVGRDISCNLGSMDIAKAMDGGNLGETIEVAVRSLSRVSDILDVSSVPSVQKGNTDSHAIGLGQMNMHGFLGRESIHYDSPEAIEFTSAYFAAVAYHSIKASNRLAIERNETFVDFDKSTYANGEFFEKYVTREWHPTSDRIKGLFGKFHIVLPTIEDWKELKESVMAHGIFNAYLQAVPPTGSISYIRGVTSSIHPIAALVEIRKEGRLGRVYYPAAYATNENTEYFKSAYDYGPRAIIDVYAAATEHTDQGLSCTLFFPEGTTPRAINNAQIYAWQKGLKTLYYIRTRDMALAGTEIEGCVSCAL